MTTMKAVVLHTYHFRTCSEICFLTLSCATDFMKKIFPEELLICLLWQFMIQESHYWHWKAYKIWQEGFTSHCVGTRNWPLQRLKICFVQVIIYFSYSFPMWTENWLVNFYLHDLLDRRISLSLPICFGFMCLEKVIFTTNAIHSILKNKLWYLFKMLYRYFITLWLVT